MRRRKMTDYITLRFLKTETVPLGNYIPINPPTPDLAYRSIRTPPVDQSLQSQSLENNVRVSEYP
ncbi:MAG: hypothetical protein RL557_166 [archaeon]|jgi:hypothetical protein